MTKCKDCNKDANFNILGKPAIKCNEHKTEGMINVRKRICNFEGCTKYPVYSIKGKQATKCNDHKIEGMVYFKDAIYTTETCNIIASFGIEGYKAVKCNEHKIEGMIDVRKSHCTTEGCKTCPSFGMERGKPIKCFLHKIAGMFNLTKTFCQFDGCNKTATYDIKDGKGKFCYEHKIGEMVPINHNKCEIEECTIRASFGFKDQHAEYCLIHKFDGMINVILKECLEKDCIIHPSFNYPDVKSGLYCVKHAKEGMVDVINKYCKTHLCSTQVKNKYEGYCLRCYVFTYPNEPVSKCTKSKEIEVVKFVSKEFEGKKWIFDKVIAGGTSKRRPDIFLNLESHALIIEVDEQQHSSYDCECENKRLLELSKDLDHKPIVFIRFNPDAYNDDKKYKSCWKFNKETNNIKLVCKTDWFRRLNVLKETIEYWCNNTSEKMIEEIHLFYTK